MQRAAGALVGDRPDLAAAVLILHGAPKGAPEPGALGIRKDLGGRHDELQPELPAVDSCLDQVARERIQHRHIPVQVVRPKAETALPVGAQICRIECEGGEPDPVHREIGGRKAEPALSRERLPPKPDCAIANLHTEPTIAQPGRCHLTSRGSPILQHSHRLPRRSPRGLTGDAARAPLGHQFLSGVLQLALGEKG